MKGLILINAYSKLESSLNQSVRLKEEFGKMGVVCDIRNNNFFPAVIAQHSEIESGVGDYDFCIYLDKDKYVSELLEKTGLRLFNSHEAISVCDDKMCTYIRLAGSGLNLAKTLPGLLCYDSAEKIMPATVLRIEEALGYPMVAKESYGSLGKGVYKIENRGELSTIMEELKTKPHLFQRMVKSSFGRDVRIIVIGGKFCSAMLRRSDVDFRSNVELGGEGKTVDAPAAFIEAAERAAAVLGLDYCGVDLLFGEEGEPIVCEVNSNAFFGGMEKVTGVNVARAYAAYVLKAIAV